MMRKLLARLFGCKSKPAQWGPDWDAPRWREYAEARFKREMENFPEAVRRVLLNPGDTVTIDAFDACFGMNAESVHCKRGDILLPAGEVRKARECWPVPHTLRVENDTFQAAASFGDGYVLPALRAFDLAGEASLLSAREMLALRAKLHPLKGGAA